MASQNNIEITPFKDNELVWGKVAGYPWWPAQIHPHTNHPQHLYQVDFFGYPASQAWLPNNKIIKYDQFDKAHITNRLSPQLKRAITQANSLFYAIQQSKIIYPNSSDPSNENTILSAHQNEEKSWLIQSSFHETQNSNRKIKVTSDELNLFNIIQPKKKKSRNSKRMREKEESSARCTPEEIEKILQPYRLNNIPLPLEQMLENQQYGATVKKFYRVFKKTHSKSMSRKLAIQVTKEIIETGEWRSKLKQYKLNDQTDRELCNSQTFLDVPHL